MRLVFFLFIMSPIHYYKIVVTCFAPGALSIKYLFFANVWFKIGRLTHPNQVSFKENLGWKTIKFQSIYAWVIRGDRDCFGGGVTVYIADHLQFNLINNESSSNIEALWFELAPPKSKKIFFGSLCRPPNSDASVFSGEIESMLTSYSKDDEGAIFLGDFNFDMVLNSTGLQPRAKNFLRIPRAFHLTKIISECTRIMVLFNWSWVFLVSYCSDKNIGFQFKSPGRRQVYLIVIYGVIAWSEISLGTSRSSYEYEIKYEYDLRISNQWRVFKSPCSSCWFFWQRWCLMG